MHITSSKTNKRVVRHKRVRAKIFGTLDVPRLVVFRSLHHMEAQLVDDLKGHTLVSANDKQIKGTKTERAAAVGKALAEAAQKNKIFQVVFDRGGYQYHGRVKALAEAARKAGLKF